jgi:4-carboxymuconolactone decarboxylase
MSELFETGDATRRRTLGDAHVNRSRAGDPVLDPPFVELITEAAWGRVWSRDTIPPRERSMLTVALLAGLGNHEELRLHLRACANTGATKEDILEVMLHVAIYAGVPRANSAIRIAREVFAEIETRDG